MSLLLALAVQDNRLTEALKRIGEADSYAYTVTFESRGNDPRKTAGTHKIEGRFHKDTGFWYRTDRVEFLRIGDTMAGREGAEWFTVRRNLREHRQINPMICLTQDEARDLRLQAMMPPHEELAMLAGQIESAEAAEGGVFECRLRNSRCHPWVSGRVVETGRAIRATFWLDEASRIRKTAFVMQTEGTAGGEIFKGTYSQTIEMSGFGQTEVEIPDAARSALDK